MELSRVCFELFVGHDSWIIWCAHVLQRALEIREMILVLFLELAGLPSFLLRHEKLIHVDGIFWYSLLFLILERSISTVSISPSLLAHISPPVSLSSSPLVLLFGPSLNLHRQELAGRSDCILSPTLSSPLPRGNRLPLECRCTSIENEDRLDAEEQQLANPSEEAYDVAVAESIPLLVSNCLEKLIDPNRRVNGKSLLVKRFQLDRASTGLKDCP